MMDLSMNRIKVLAGMQQKYIKEIQDIEEKERENNRLREQRAIEREQRLNELRKNRYSLE